MQETSGYLEEAAAVTKVVHDWALWRDTCAWQKLAASYTDDAHMRTTWFDGPASEFVAKSQSMAGKGARAQHFMGSTSVEVCGDRAIAQSRVVLLVRGGLAGTQVDVTCYGRFYDRLVKRAGRWLIQHREPIYEKDQVQPVVPGEAIALEPALLAGYPEGYRYIAYLQSSGGATITPNLIEPNSAEQSRLYEQGEAWLSKGSSQLRG